MRLALVLLALSACTAAQGAAALNDIQAADDVILAGLPTACAIADVVDPTLSTVVCGIIGAAGDLIQVETKQLSSPAVAAAVVAAHPAVTPAVTMRLKASAQASVTK